MELLAFVLVWPLIVLVVGLVFISLGDIGPSYAIWSAIAFLIAFFVFKEKITPPKISEAKSAYKDLETSRRSIITFSIALLIPIFVHYLIIATNKSLTGIIIGLAIGFGAAIWGMFIKNHKTLIYSNIFGGSLTVIYVYIQLWELGELPRIIAAAFGLVIAVTISVIKLKDRLS